MELVEFESNGYLEVLANRGVQPIANWNETKPGFAGEGESAFFERSVRFYCYLKFDPIISTLWCLWLSSNVKLLVLGFWSNYFWSS